MLTCKIKSIIDEIEQKEVQLMKLKQNKVLPSHLECQYLHIIAINISFFVCLNIFQIVNTVFIWASCVIKVFLPHLHRKWQSSRTHLRPKERKKYALVNKIWFHLTLGLDKHITSMLNNFQIFAILQDD